MSKKLWITAYMIAVDQALEIGMTEEEAELYADKWADKISEDLASNLSDLTS